MLLPPGVGKLVGINITNPRKPTWASSFKTNIWVFEGTYLGGFIGDRFITLDISEPYSMKVGETI